jgi:hypothetical protein
MTDILPIIAPIFIVVALALVYARRYSPDAQVLSSVVLYLFAPMLVFRSMAETNITGGEMTQITLVAVGVAAILAMISLLTGRVFGLDRRTESAVVVGTTLINAANYGIPVNAFAFGAAGEQRAVIYYVLTVIIANTVGVFFASRGSVDVREALLNIFRLPLIYAAVIGLSVNLAEISIPLFLSRAVDLLADAAIPAMLVVLGFQLARAKVAGRLAIVFGTSGLRLLAGPAIALLLALLLGIDGVTRQVVILQSAMPTAVIAGVLAVQYDADAELITGVILASTLLSVITVSGLLLIL